MQIIKVWVLTVDDLNSYAHYFIISCCGYPLCNNVSI